MSKEIKKITEKGIKKVEPYESFCFVFDEIAEKTEHERVKYGNWHKFIKTIWKNGGLKPESLVDFACGTGSNSVIYAKEGLKVYGIDKSKGMLAVAKKKSKNLNITFIHGSFMDFKLPCKVDAAICLDFSTNYLLSKEEFIKFINRVFDVLDDNGIFIFDFKPCEAFLKKELHVKDDNFSFDCMFDIKNKPFVNVEMKIKVKDKNKNEIKEYLEKHLERGYNIDEMKEIVSKTKFKLIGFFDDCKFQEPKNDSELIQVVLRKIKKES